MNLHQDFKMLSFSKIYHMIGSANDAKQIEPLFFFYISLFFLFSSSSSSFSSSSSWLYRLVVPFEKKRLIEWLNGYMIFL